MASNVPKVNGYSAKFAKYCLDMLLGTETLYPVPEAFLIYLSVQEQDFDINKVGVPAGFVPYAINPENFWIYYSEDDIIWEGNALDIEFQRAPVDYGYIISLFVLPDPDTELYPQQFGGTISAGVDIFANDIPVFLTDDFRIGFYRPIT